MANDNPIPLDLADLRSAADRLVTQEKHSAAARLRAAADELERLREGEHHHRTVLLSAILAAAQRAGICRPDVEALDGPTAIMLCRDLGEEVARFRAERLDLAATQRRLAACSSPSERQAIANGLLAAAAPGGGA